MRSSRKKLAVNEGNITSESDVKLLENLPEFAFSYLLGSSFISQVISGIISWFPVNLMAAGEVARVRIYMRRILVKSQSIVERYAKFSGLKRNFIFEKLQSENHSNCLFNILLEDYNKKIVEQDARCNLGFFPTAKHYVLSESRTCTFCVTAHKHCIHPYAKQIS